MIGNVYLMFESQPRDTDLENVILIRCSVSDGKETYRSKGVSLISVDRYIINFIKCIFTV